MLAASSMALKRVTRTPFLASSIAPKAVATVKVAGKATGTEATNKIRANGSKSLIGRPDKSA